MHPQPQRTETATMTSRHCQLRRGRAEIPAMYGEYTKAPTRKVDPHPQGSGLRSEIATSPGPSPQLRRRIPGPYPAGRKQPRSPRVAVDTQLELPARP
ncbi:hypothetical protein EJ06DRAFT_79158 [Trichodelitschia bisporula]|uniref:Uncharacterized protein n=1 Tax=Trichodelitschia bisporula TaxID=703511 RepID=A0A6G1HTP7_9PEZI|nr:hypothetical protein EJ06DRAFT_79158 [Trichodelitschia bisporula]